MSTTYRTDLPQLDRPVFLAELRRLAPSLRVLGGCCGTTHEHDAISAACVLG